jgi:transcriptional regulator with XRE-family HTH domain
MHFDAKIVTASTKYDFSLISGCRKIWGLEVPNIKKCVDMLYNFAPNLRLLCSYYKSTAEVCRRLDMNRPQFNRYLNGRSKPSSNTMQRICNFFGVEEYEILLPHDQFQRLIQVRPRTQTAGPTKSPHQEHINRLLQAGSAGLDKYLGYYFEHYQSMAYPGKIIRTLVCLEMRDGQVYYQRTERLREEASEKIYHAIYLGIVLLLTDRIFMMDYETLTGNQITQTILIPSYKNRINRLSGLRQGVSGSGERTPCSARVVYEYLGTSVDLQSALRLCGLYDQDSSDIDKTLKRGIANDIAATEWHLRAKHL